MHGDDRDPGKRQDDRIVRVPGQSGAELGKMITGFYGENMKKAGFASECTMATLDLSKIEYVKLALM